MIVLQNELFTCQQCLLVDKAQKCCHLKENLVSVNSSSKVQVRTSSNKFNIDGSYRFRINTKANKIPIVKRKISPQNHQNDEILFHKDLRINTNLSIGPVIYILDDNTLIEFELYLPTAESNKNSIKNKMVIDFTTSFNKRNNLNSQKSNFESVLIRPLEKQAKPISKIANCSKSPIELPFEDLNIHEFHENNKSSPSEESIEIKKPPLKLIVPDVKYQMDEFLKETEQFLNDFLI